MMDYGYKILLKKWKHTPWNFHIFRFIKYKFFLKWDLLNSRKGVPADYCHKTGVLLNVVSCKY